MTTSSPVLHRGHLIGVVTPSLSGEYQAWIRHRFHSKPGNVHQLVGILPSNKEAEARVVARSQSRQDELNEVWESAKRNASATVAEVLVDSPQEQRMRCTTGLEGEWQVVARQPSDGIWWVVD